MLRSCEVEQFEPESEQMKEMELLNNSILAISEALKLNVEDGFIGRSEVNFILDAELVVEDAEELALFDALTAVKRLRLAQQRPPPQPSAM